MYTYRLEKLPLIYFFTNVQVRKASLDCIFYKRAPSPLLTTEFMLDAMNTKAKKKSKGDSKKITTLISAPQDFRRVCAIVDADMLPDTVRRVKLLKHSSDKPLGFYIRDGTSVRVTPYGLEKVPGIFISRLVPGGLAEGTGLLAVNDEILEVNGIEVLGKSLDQVTDMMVANSQNLIITVKPASAPPPTPRMNPAGTKKAKPPTPNASIKSSNSLSTVVAKSHPDLPSVTATPPQHSKHQSPTNSTHSNLRMGDFKKVESWGDSLDQIASNGPRRAIDQDDLLKRHSAGGILES